jgi:hypothetical protein
MVESVAENWKHAPLYLAVLYHIVWSAEYWHEVLINGVDEYLKI